MFSIFQLWTYHSSKWPPICSIFRIHYPVLFSFMTYHCVCNRINTTAATCGARNVYPSWAPEFTSVFGFLCNALLIIGYPCLFSFSYCIVCTSLIYRFCVPLLVASNFSYNAFYKKIEKSTCGKKFLQYFFHFIFMNKSHSSASIWKKNC